MRWKQGRRSTNVEDMRGRRATRGASVGCGTLVLALLASMILGVDPTQILQLFSGGGTGVVQQQAPPSTSAPTDEVADFVSVVLADTEDVWGQLFAQAGSQYREPKLRLYTDAVQSACGYNTAATGPFYCPGDERVYLDLGFLRELQRMGATGDFSVAYVLAHEVGHHIQRITGIEPQVRQMQQRAGEAQRNQLSVLMELQADCYAGVWAHHAHQQRQILEQGDIEEAMGAAAAVGDDRIQRSAGRRVSPESFTHGSSAQRQQWFQTGLQTGRIDACDTFGQAR